MCTQTTVIIHITPGRPRRCSSRPMPSLWAQATTNFGPHGVLSHGGNSARWCGRWKGCFWAFKLAFWPLVVSFAVLEAGYQKGNWVTFSVKSGLQIPLHMSNSFHLSWKSTFSAFFRKNIGEKPAFQKGDFSATFWPLFYEPASYVPLAMTIPLASFQRWEKVFLCSHWDSESVSLK